MRVTAVLSWIVILTLAIGLPVLHAVNAHFEKAQRVAATHATSRPTLPGTGTDVLPTPIEPAAVSLELRFASRYAVGSKMLAGVTEPALVNQLDAQAKSDADRVAIAVVAGEVQGREAALKRLAEIDGADARLFERAYATTDADEEAFPQSDLHPRYGFFADLAATHGKPSTDGQRQRVEAAAKQSVYIAISLLIVGVIALFCGVALGITAIVLLVTGKLRFKTRRPLAPATYYVEAFAIYLVLLLSGSSLTIFLPADAPIALKLLPMVAVVLFAAAWPLIRMSMRPVYRGTGFRPVLASPEANVSVAEAADHALETRAKNGLLPPQEAVVASAISPWQAYRLDVGLHTGTGLFREIGWGIVGYIAGLPIIGIALLVVLLLSRFAETTTSHPIVQTVDNTSIWSLLLLAAVFAPITEELMFRGVFVSHLRRGVGVVLAALISGLIFAAVHPQGWLAIPALTAIGGWLAIVRQWRDSLIPSIVIHAINNGLIVCLLVGLLK